MGPPAGPPARRPSTAGPAAGAPPRAQGYAAGGSRSGPARHSSATLPVLCRQATTEFTASALTVCNSAQRTAR
jgi:hypothetical protein